MKPMRKKKLEPGYEGRMEVREATVVSPYLNPDVKGQQTERVQRNVRHDILEKEFAYKHINEEQKAAGDEFLATYERAGIGGGQAIDYGNPKVDTSGKGDPVTDGVIAAHQRLRIYAAKLGEDDYRLLVMTICEGRKLKDIAADRYAPYLSENARVQSEGYVGRRWRDALTKLAGGTAQGKETARIRVHAPERPARPDTWQARHVPLNL